MSVMYDIIPSAVQGTLSQVEASADSAQTRGSRVSTQGQEVAGLCGTATAVADAFARLWAQRSQTGVRSGNYASGCAAAVAQACAAISEGDEQMQSTASMAGARASSAVPFGRQGQ
ncbi:hypothetical protein [Nesterenkonia sp. F]|uniref:hypothetical protein n=1 Tax=Nesterenkonia sp. F TaxID=795955 RepID=UPI000255C898|nr:hypothetical protein [Nesterenkonia sp. F]